MAAKHNEFEENPSRPRDSNPRPTVYETVVVFDNVADGLDVDGNVTTNGNKTVLFGQGPAVSVIGGNVTFNGNESIGRGLYIKGNVRFKGNHGRLAWCVVEGDVIFDGNDNVLAECDVFGKVQIAGGNNKLYWNDIQKGVEISNDSFTCEGNRGFSDVNKNFVIEPSELGAALVCKKK